MGILKPDIIKETDIKENKSNEFFRKSRELLETKLYSKNLI